MVTRARTEVFADLHAQSHRRFIKTRTQNTRSDLRQASVPGLSSSRLMWCSAG